MSNLTVLIIRHAEKPEEAFPGPGLTEQGAQDKRALVIRGWQRAGAWSALFGAGLGGTDYPSPGRIYAASPVIGHDGGHPTLRMAETITPLAQRLSLTPIERFGRGDEAALAAEVSGTTGIALICWEHKLITRTLLPALLQGASPPGVPADWDPTRFDVVLRLDRTASGWRFRQLLPQLLPGDSAAPLA